MLHRFSFSPYNLYMDTHDIVFLERMKKVGLPFARFALFLVFFWFGILKILYTSPANPLVDNLLQHTLPFITFNTFIFLFGIFEMLIGVLFLFPKLTRLAVIFLALHMITTIMPLILLPEATWQAPFVPTLEGQYIIKNILIIALAVILALRMKPLSLRSKIAQ